MWLGESEIYRTCSIHTSKRPPRVLAAIKMHSVVGWTQDDQSMTSAVDGEEAKREQANECQWIGLREVTGGGKRTEQHEASA